MDSAFLTVLNMSLTGAFVITAVCLARLPLKKAPKIISYCWWALTFDITMLTSISRWTLLVRLIPCRLRPFKCENG